MFTSRTRIRSTCCRVKRPASQRSRKSCSSSLTSSSRSIFWARPWSRASSAALTERLYSSCISSSRSSFSNWLSTNLFSTRATGVPVQYLQSDWTMEVTCSSSSFASDSFLVFAPLFMKMANRTLRPSFSTKTWQFSGQCRNAWSASFRAKLEAKTRSFIMRIISSNPWRRPKANWLAFSSISEQRQSNMFCTYSDSSLSAGSRFRYAAMPRSNLSTPSSFTIESLAGSEFCRTMPKISEA
mmetsp:Transcript_46368/g.108333  ORF Transcript_46368/g.108333 Transcript_46368/m.108333 type:complete len:241 (-) Transcript_46368:429-1151(-)